MLQCCKPSCGGEKYLLLGYSMPSIALRKAIPFFWKRCSNMWLRRRVGRGRGWMALETDRLLAHPIESAGGRRASRHASGTDVSQQVLQLAAVAGQRSILPPARDHAQRRSIYLEIMKELIAAGLVIEESVGPFTFRHALTRQAITQDCWRGSDAHCMARLPGRWNGCMLQPWMLYLPEVFWPIILQKRNSRRTRSTRAAEQAQALSAPAPL